VGSHHCGDSTCMKSQVDPHISTWVGARMVDRPMPTRESAVADAAGTLPLPLSVLCGTPTGASVLFCLSPLCWAAAERPLSASRRVRLPPGSRPKRGRYSSSLRSALASCCVGGHGSVAQGQGKVRNRSRPCVPDTFVALSLTFLSAARLLYFRQDHPGQTAEHGRHRLLLHHQAAPRGAEQAGLPQVRPRRYVFPPAHRGPSTSC